MKTFTHKFFGWLEAEATRYINDDGSEGAIVALTATVAKGLRLSASIEIGPDVSIGPGVSIGSAVRIGPDVSIGSAVRIGPDVSIGSGVRIGSDVRIGPAVRIGSGVRIGSDVRIGSRVSIGSSVSIGSGEWFITVGPQGSRNAMLTAVQKPEGLRWWVGCKCNISTDELRGLVAATHGDSAHAADYLHVIEFVEAHPARLRKAVAQ